MLHDMQLSLLILCGMDPNKDSAIYVKEGRLGMLYLQAVACTYHGRRLCYTAPYLERGFCYNVLCEPLHSAKAAIPVRKATGTTMM